MITNFDHFVRQHGSDSVPIYARPGGYPLFYIAEDGGNLCAKCVNDNLAMIKEHTRDRSDPQWQIVDYAINYEDSDLRCDHCGERIESAYAEDEDEAISTSD